MLEVRVLESEELHIWVELRLKALAEAPGAFGDTVDEAKQRSLAEWRESLLHRDGALLIARELEIPVGMARVRKVPEKPTSAGLYSMWVAPAARGHGVGRALVEAACAWAEQQLVDEMTLFVAQGNAAAAKRLYVRAGFIETGTLLPLRSNPNVQMEEMVRRISRKVL